MIRIKNITRIALLVTIALTFSACKSAQKEKKVAIKPVKFELRLADDTQQGGLKDKFVRTTRKTVFVHPTPILTTADVVEAYAATETATQARVELFLTPEGAKKLTAATTKYMEKKRLATFLDGRIVSAPQIVEVINTGRIKVTEIMPMAKATALAKRFPSKKNDK